MIGIAKAKINLGLNIVERRPDGYHNLETVFYPISLYDQLEVQPMDANPLSGVDCDISVSGIPVEGDVQNNLVVKAYRLLKAERPDMPRVRVHLYKNIPTQAGLGGGSSDCSSMMVMLNDMFNLGFTPQELIERSARLGADCPFFILRRPAYAEGIGERLQPIGLDLRGWFLILVKPAVAVSTKEAFALVTPHHPVENCLDVMARPVEEWRDRLVNDFEQSVFAQYPEIGRVKQQLYDLGAVYSAMSGSGSTVFAFFNQPLDNLEEYFPGMFTKMLLL